MIPARGRAGFFSNNRIECALYYGIKISGQMRPPLAPDDNKRKKDAFFTKIYVKMVQRIFSSIMTKEKVVVCEIWHGNKKKFVEKTFFYQNIEPK